MLGVAKTASANELKKAFRKLVSKYHPESNRPVALMQQALAAIK
ncbi:MAG: DnaJ domain-containing protein, partial [Giesbergeria sp.]|nr:DnaJ domain-containing protein [Giesbergeria sp.]